MMNFFKLVCFLVVQLLFIGFFIYLYKSDPSANRLHLQKPITTSLLSPHVQIFDLNQNSSQPFRCIQSKTLLNMVRTHVCLYENEKDIFVSGSFRGQDSIWEEGGVKMILDLLLRHPHLDFIDIGANIGTYTMYVAALGRFVLAIDCFRPNLERLRRALQLRHVTNRVILIENALYTSTGDSLRLNFNARNIGGQDLVLSVENQTMKKEDPYVVRTIQFDDLLPLLIDRKVRGAVMKMDIEGSESFVVQSGEKIFDAIDIPYVMMEWMNVKHYPDRMEKIFEFFNRRQYEARTLSCQVLNQAQHQFWPSDICWIKQNVSRSFCS